MTSPLMRSREPLADTPAGGSREPEPLGLSIHHSGVRERTKRAFDVVVALVGLVIAMPLMVSIALALRLEDGQAVFRQARPGRHLVTFPCLKFRTMARDAEGRLARLLSEDRDLAVEYASRGKLRRDPRITRLGRFLRLTSLDELPQLFNVLRGDMSIVGPRPITMREIDRYGADHLGQAMRVRPGLTGPWQVSGRSDTTYGQRIALDAAYAERNTMWGDLLIICRTIRVLARPGTSGAY